MGYIEDLTKAQFSTKKAITKTAEKDIALAYGRAISQMADELEKTNSALKAEYLLARIKGVYKELDAIVSKSTDQAVIASANQYRDLVIGMIGESGLKSSGEMDKLFGKTQAEALKALRAGSIYTDGRGLDSRIWGTSATSLNSLNQRIQSAIIRGEDARTLAQGLREYVEGDAMKDWDKSKMRNLLGYSTRNAVDYNAMRLARTAISHSYSLANRINSSKLPYAAGFIWHSAHSERTCEICEERDGKFFTAEEMPFDHPNGLCWEEPAFDKSEDEIIEDLRNWIHGAENPILDTWSKANGYNIENAVLTSTAVASSPKATEKIVKAVSQPPLKFSDGELKIINARASWSVADEGAEAVSKEQIFAWAREVNAIEDPAGKLKLFRKYADDLVKREMPGIENAGDFTMSLQGNTLFVNDVAVGNVLPNVSTEFLKSVADDLAKIKSFKDLETFRKAYSDDIALNRINVKWGELRNEANRKTFEYRAKLPKNDGTLKAFTTTNTRKAEVKLKLAKADEWFREHIPYNMHDVKHKYMSGRAYSNPEGIFVGDENTSVFVHEIGHQLHDNNKAVRTLISDWFGDRTKSFPFGKINSLGEKGYAADFFKPYVGRVYDFEARYYGKTNNGLEVFSMGIQAMQENPARFYKDDPDHFKLIYAIMRGLIPGSAK